MEKINPIGFNGAEYSKIKKDEPTVSNENNSVDFKSKKELKKKSIAV